MGGRRNGDGYLRIGGKREILGTAARTSVDLSWLGLVRLSDEDRRRKGEGDSEKKHKNGGAGSRRSSPKEAMDLLHRTENQACGPERALEDLPSPLAIEYTGKDSNLPLSAGFPPTSSPNAFTHSSRFLNRTHQRHLPSFHCFPSLSLLRS